MIKSTWGNYWATAIAMIAISPVLLAAPVTAQSITAAQDGTNTVILPNGQRFDITGGTQAGANLFHSFQQFGLSQGQVANFLSQPNIQNILGRVVGGDPSVINGLIQLTGGSSNLYIMNPAGVIFGSNASLNVPASFTATTANGIQVGNSWFGMNTIASDLKNLTGTPNAFAFTSPSTNIQNQTGVIVNQGNLNVSQGKSITLVGGIVINTGTIQSPNGNINIVAVPDGKYVRITPEGGVLSFDLAIATQQELGNTTLITGIDLPKLLTGSGIVAPTKAGDAIASGNLTAANINVLANRYDTTQASLTATNIQQGWNFVFIDSTIKNYQTLLDGTKGGSSVTVINPDQYGIAQVTATLASVTGANSLHIVSEGDVGNFWLGKDFVSTENIAKYSNDLQAWKTSLSPAANILLYACNLASGENGTALVQAVKNYTGHDVAASTNRTGAVALGGDWNLEYQTGAKPASVIFNNAATSAYQNTLAILTVLNTADTGANSLRERIGAALAGDTIKFDPTLNGTAIVLTGEIAFTTSDLTISGNGSTNTIIDGGGVGRVFNITANVPVTFDSVTIRNGSVAGNGGGIRSSGAVTLTNSTVSVNMTSFNGNGGGIFSNGAVTLTNSTVSGNTASNNSGGISSNGAVTLTNSTVSGNMASGNSGGILSNGAVTLTNSTVSGNTADRDGGGIYSNGAVTLTNSTVSGNTITANGNGGGIFSFGDATLTNSTVSGNTANSVGGGIFGNGAVTLTNSTVSGNTSNFDGGGIYSNNVINGAVTLTNSTVSDNKASNVGGGIFVNGAVTLTNSTVSGNTANSDGGGIYGNNSGTITNSTITNNTTTTGDGGGIFRSSGIFTIANSIVAGNFKGATVQDLGSSVATLGFADGGNNIIGANNGFETTFVNSALVGTIANPVNPQLAPLANNGGPTQTHALLPNSPALDAGNNAKAPVDNDQRGLPRISGNNVDIGAFEFQVIPPVLTPPTQFSISKGGFGGVFPSREDLEGRSPRLDEQDLEVSFTKVLCLDPSLATAQTTSIPTCKK
jgi:filamentous hemagglutinin family protein